MLEGLSTVGSPYFLSFDKHAFLHTFGQKTEGMSSILQQPDTLSLSQNLKKFVIHSDDQVSFVLRHKEEEILSQLYDPSSDGRIEVDLRDIVHARLSYMLKEETLPYEQTALVGDFTAVIDETEVTFRVVRGGVDRLADTAANFLTQNWLTWQPTVKPVTYYSPEYLTYYAPVACSVKLKATFADQTDTTLTYHALEAGKAYTLPMQYSVIVGKLGDKKPAYYDAWVENEEGERLTYIQRYYADNMRSIHEDWVLFENSLGGLDCFRAYGTTELEAEHTHNIAEIDEVSEEYRVDTERKYQKNTGHLGKDEARWLLDFFPAAKKYIYTGNYLRAIVVVESNVTGNLRELPSNYTFTYRYADARPLLNLPRTDVPVEMLNIEIPEVGNFTLPPRLAEVERLPLSEGDLFPVQNPYSEKWGTTTTGALATVIGQLLGESAGSGGGVGHTHQNIDLLKALSYVLEYLLVNGKKIKAGYADIAGDIEGDKFIRKDREDGTNYLLKIGEFIDSLTAGKGIGLFPDGRAQVSSLEVRDSLTVLRLIINEITAMSGDYNFSDAGHIKKVEALEDNTYKLWMEKRTEFDVTNFESEDVLYSIVNNLLTGGQDYYTSWFRVLTKNVNDNTLTVVLYPDSEVPGGKNYPPVAGYNVTRRGNAVTPGDNEPMNERAQNWLLSSREGCIMFLQNVFKPVLEDYNYALTVGKLPNMKALEQLPVTTDDVGIVAQTIITENLYQYDYNGDIVPKRVNRGLWSLATAQSDKPYRNVQYEANRPTGTTYTLLEQHTVSHYGCTWGCLIDKTTEEPRWNSSAWVMLEGDPNYRLDFDSTNDWQFFRGQVDTVVTALLSHGNRDITEALMSTTGTEVEWLRDSGNSASDNTWKPSYVDGQKHVIHLTNADMPVGWGQSIRKVKFICRVAIPVGGAIETVENYIGFKS